ANTSLSGVRNARLHVSLWSFSALSAFSAVNYPANPDLITTMRFWRLLKNWLLADRIRAPSDDGAIWRLVPSAILPIGDIPFEFVARHVVFLANGTAIVYDCASDRTRCRLRVEPAVPTPRVVYVDSHGEVVLTAGDFEIFSVQGSHV